MGSITSRRARSVGCALALMALAGCGAGAGSSAGPSSSGEVVAVATTTPLGSVLAQITECAGAESATLMSPGQDPHDFAPSSTQLAQLVSTKLIVANGLGLEGGFSDALENARADGAVLYEVAPQVDPLEFGGGHDDASSDGHNGGSGHGSQDPHFWLDVSRMASAAAKIGAKLSDVTGDEAYTSCGAQVADDLRETEVTIRDILSVVPPDARSIVTDHDALGYFAAAYDFDVVAVVVPGGSTQAKPSSADLAALVRVIQDEKVPAIFSNVAVSAQLVDAVAAESGRGVAVVPLYVGSLGPVGSEAATYQGMMRFNATAIADALRP